MCFAVIKNSLKADHLRYIGLQRIQATVSLTELLHNLLRVGHCGRSPPRAAPRRTVSSLFRGKFVLLLHPAMPSKPPSSTSTSHRNSPEGFFGVP